MRWPAPKLHGVRELSKTKSTNNLPLYTAIYTRMQQASSPNTRSFSESRPNSYQEDAVNDHLQCAGGAFWGGVGLWKRPGATDGHGFRIYVRLLRICNPLLEIYPHRNLFHLHSSQLSQGFSEYTFRTCAWHRQPELAPPLLIDMHHGPCKYYVNN